MFSPIDDILADLRAGRMVILTDDEQRENEGDLVLPAQAVSPEAITFMLSVARGYLCLSLTEADCDRLDLYPQSPVNTTARGTAFTVSIDGHPRHGFTTGVSAHERARCIKRAIDPASTPDDFVRPGHINPLRSRNGGVLVRTGQTEGSIDLCRLAGLPPSAVIIEVMRDDGEMARLPDLEQLARRHNLKMCSVAQIIEHRLSRESLVRRLEPAAGRPVRTALGTFNAIVFESLVDPLPHLVLTAGDVGRLDPQQTPIERSQPTLVRMHRRHLLGDIFGDLDSAGNGDGCTGDILRASMRLIQEDAARGGGGAIVYLRTQSAGHSPSQREGARGWVGEAPSPGTAELDDLEGRLQTLRLPDPVDASSSPHAREHGARALPMAQRDFGIGGQILRNLGLRKLRLITDHPRPMPGLDAFGLEITETVPPRRVPQA